MGVDIWVFVWNFYSCILLWFSEISLLFWVVINILLELGLVKRFDKGLLSFIVYSNLLFELKVWIFLLFVLVKMIFFCVFFIEILLFVLILKFYCILFFEEILYIWLFLVFMIIELFEVLIGVEDIFFCSLMF